MLAPPWALYGSASAPNGYQQLPLYSEIYAALGAIDDEIHILRLRSIPGPSKAFALI
jgi:hypothetical protein